MSEIVFGIWCSNLRTHWTAKAMRRSLQVVFFFTITCPLFLFVLIYAINSLQ